MGGRSIAHNSFVCIIATLHAVGTFNSNVDIISISWSIEISFLNVSIVMVGFVLGD